MDKIRLTSIFFYSTMSQWCISLHCVIFQLLLTVCTLRNLDDSKFSTMKVRHLKVFLGSFIKEVLYRKKTKRLFLLLFDVAGDPQTVTNVHLFMDLLKEALSCGCFKGVLHRFSDLLQRISHFTIQLFEDAAGSALEKLEKHGRSFARVATARTENSRSILQESWRLHRPSEE